MRRVEVLLYVSEYKGFRQICVEMQYFSALEPEKSTFWCGVLVGYKFVAHSKTDRKNVIIFSSFFYSLERRQYFTHFLYSYVH